MVDTPPPPPPAPYPPSIRKQTKRQTTLLSRTTTTAIIITTTATTTKGRKVEGGNKQERGTYSSPCPDSLATVHYKLYDMWCPEEAPQQNYSVL